jgi:hypothetical protein
VDETARRPVEEIFISFANIPSLVGRYCSEQGGAYVHAIARCKHRHFVCIHRGPASSLAVN